MLIAVVGCSAESPPVVGELACREIALAQPPAHPGVVLIVNDTMRRDRIGIHGGPAATPHFDAFAREHLLFERAVTQSPWTKPSIASLFTSLYPSQHGVAADPATRDSADVARDGALEEADVLSEDFVTLAEVLGGAGFRTAAFVSNPWLGSRFGFDQGFEIYDDSFASWGVSGRVVTREALAWLADIEPDEPFFLYLHYIDSHRPYGRLTPRRAASVRPQPGDRFEPDSDGDKLVRAALRLTDGRSVLDAAGVASRALVAEAYDRGIEDFDRTLGAFLRRFRDMPAWERSAVLITSDHGEALFTRDYGNHGRGLYEDEIAIPLAVRLPGTTVERSRIDCLVGLVDVMPTLCSYLGIACPDSASGWSFVSDLRSEPDTRRRYLVTEGVMHRPTHRAIRNRRYKLLYEPEGARDGRWRPGAFSLFDLEADPSEQDDHTHTPWRFIQQRGVLREMTREMSSAVEAYEAPAMRQAPVDSDTRRRLRELGYLD